MTDIVSPFEWLTTPMHYQGLSLALGVTLTAAACSIVLNGAVWSTALVGILSALMFTFISIPFVQMYWGLPWPWWLVIGTGWGIISVLAMRSLIRAAERIYERTPDIVDGGIRRFEPSAPAPSEPGVTR